MQAVRKLVSVVLLGIFLMPSPRILDPERTHKRHAACAHHLRHHHPDEAEQARILRRAERRRQRREEALLLEQARIERSRQEQAQRAALVREADVPQLSASDQERRDDARLAAQDLEESNLQPCQAAADPQDDDSSMKKGRRRAKMKTLFWSLQDPPRIRPAGDFLALLRVHLEQRHVSPSTAADMLPHYGSGPCHSIPRPREGTVIADEPCLSVVA